ncbi:MAG TPA: hypothetical protein VND65_18610 [Candidatus Binatia bacterium]|nr:hypothetical protein [Candidatus Binatia bacterium]
MRSWLAVILLFSGMCLAQSIPAPGGPAPRRQLDTLPSPSLPFSPGNWSQLTKLISGGPLSSFYFGYSVAIAGDTVVVGTQPSITNSTVAYVFLKNAQGWQSSLPVGSLKIPIENAFFESVAIDGDTVVVGVPYEYFSSSGAVFVYVKPAGGWTDNLAPTAVLTSTEGEDSYFGQSVAISGNTIVVGDGGYSATLLGAAYVYVKPAGGWRDTTETAKLTTTDGAAGDGLGTSVSISGATIAVGAPQDGFQNGKAYVYVEPAGGWTSTTQTAELTTNGTYPGAGTSIATTGNVVLTGAPDNGGGGYIFVEPASGWRNMRETAILTPGDGQQFYFGARVGLSGNIAVLGASERGSRRNYGAGAVYVFEEPASGWQNMSSTTVLTGSDARYYSALGSSVAIDGKVIVTGAQPFFSQGAAYIFGLP